MRNKDRQNRMLNKSIPRLSEELYETKEEVARARKTANLEKVNKNKKD